MRDAGAAYFVRENLISKPWRQKQVISKEIPGVCPGILLFLPQCLIPFFFCFLSNTVTELAGKRNSLLEANGRENFLVNQHNAWMPATYLSNIFLKYLQKMKLNLSVVHNGWE